MDASLGLPISLLIVFVLVVANGLFVAAEFALVRSRVTKLKNEDLIDKWGVRSSLQLLEDLDGSLSVTQLGITVASLILGWWGESTFQRLIFGAVDFLGEASRLLVSHAVATAFALVAITYLHVVLGELVAKSLAIRFPETTLRIVAWPTLFFAKVCRPAIFVLNGSATIFLRLVGVRTSADIDRVHSSAELAMLISHSTQEGVLDKDEERMLKGVFGFSETVAREVMTPRTDLVTIRYNATLPQVVELSVKTGFSRIPIIGERVDDILGVLLVRDIFPYFSSGTGEFDIRRIMREPYFVPSTKPIDDLLKEFQKRKIHLAIVLDEHGGVDGVVTMEDLLEEIVGEIYDESDVPETDIVAHDNGEVLVRGGVLVSDLNARFHFGLMEGDYDTIAGYIFTHLGRVARAGDRLVVCTDDTVVFSSEKVRKLFEAVENRALLSANQVNTDSTTSAPVKLPKLLMTIEKVIERRVDSVKIIPYKLNQDKVESTPKPGPSENTGVAYLANERQGSSPVVAEKSEIVRQSK